jgi:GNAT superfamily N-acetyltransferase
LHILVTMIEIRSAEIPDTLDDARVLVRAHVSSALDLEATNTIVDALPNPYVPPRGGLWVAYVNGEPAGSAALREHERDIAEIKRMYVAPSHRKKGVARALLRHLVAEAKRLRYKTLRLGTLTTMSAAQSLYESEGFRSIPAYRPVEFGDTAFYELELTGPWQGR